MKTLARCLLVVIILTVNLPRLLGADEPAGKPKAWPIEVEQALTRAGSNRAELERALTTSSAERRPGMIFLIANMPDGDLQSLHADFLLENVALAYQARVETPWGPRIPEAIFRNQVLPYANVDESRHPWRKEMLDRCRPLIKDCKTPSEAAQVLNATLFKTVNVRYSTGRRKAQQSPKESMEQGTASCTGLSILLVDACRSVGVPARLVGTPLWTNNSGNHTWVEIWDEGWHFTGACEPDPKGLDRGWFVANAAEAQADSRLHAIYAASFEKTTVSFPLVWNRARQDVYAENVTARYAKPKEKPDLSPEQARQIEQAAREFFSADPAKQAQWAFDPQLDQWLARADAAVRQAVWTAYRAAPSHAAQQEDFAKKQVRHGQYLSPYTVKQVGTRPPNGWPLFIALHGGGGVAKQVNDAQWKVMQQYYRDQSSGPGYLYVALRAPNDVWNGFYDTYVPPLVTNLIRQFLLFGDVAGNQVYLMGYSHGGYGAFFIGPKIADRFAAIHSSAAAPTAGTISPRTLRNTRFTFMVGSNDNAYSRRKFCEEFNAAVEKLKAQDPEGYPIVFELKDGYGHGGLPDRDKIKEMLAFTRDPQPHRLCWDVTDAVIGHFFWLSVQKPAPGQRMEATLHENKVEVVTEKVDRFTLNLDGRLLALDKPLQVTCNGRTETHLVRPRFATLCLSLGERGDPLLASTCQVEVNAERQ